MICNVSFFKKTHVLLPLNKYDYSTLHDLINLPIVYETNFKNFNLIVSHITLDKCLPYTVKRFKELRFSEYVTYYSTTF